MWRESDERARSSDIPAARTRSLVTRAVTQFALSGIAALLLLGFAGVYLLRHTARAEAIKGAKQVTALAAHGVAEPNIRPGLSQGNRAAIASLDRAVRGILDGRIVRVKIWRPDGRIVYSDVHSLIGTNYPSGADERRLLATGGVEADVSDLSLPENRFERRYGKLLEVYMPIKDASGQPLMFETYQRYSSIAASSRQLWLAFAPAILGTLALLWLVQLPLAWRVARSLRAGQRQRELLLQRAIDASELERRRIARDLHDGAVQDLAGVSYALSAEADTVSPDRLDEAAATMREAATGTRRTIKQLRSLLVDIYPPDLHRTGLEAALRDLVAPLAPRGVDARVEVSSDLRLTPGLETLFYRCAQEAIRNVVAHAQAANVAIIVETDHELARMIVEDDGRGIDPDVEEGHLGLRLLSDLATEAGGRLKLDTGPAGTGTRVCIEVPQK
jgi:signal transduction histidine kinase